MLRRLLHGLLSDWDFWLIWACIFAIAMALAGMAGATIEAIQHARAYH